MTSADWLAFTTLPSTAIGSNAKSTKAGIRNLTSTPPTLEQLFLRHYVEQGDSADEQGDSADQAEQESA